MGIDAHESVNNLYNGEAPSPIRYIILQKRRFFLMRRVFGFTMSGLFLALLLLFRMPVCLAADRSQAISCLYYTYQQPEGFVSVSLGSVNEVTVPPEASPAFDYFACTLVYADPDYDRLLDTLGASIVWEQELNGMRILYAHSPRIAGSVTLDGKRVNLQLVLRGDVMLAGSPLIVGSY